jgi:hypothetical protein
MKIDHLVWAVPNLEQGVDYFEQLTGLRAAGGGSHPGRGSRNALLSFGNDQYIELIAPDPAQSVQLTKGQFSGIYSMQAPALYTFAVKCDDIEALVEKASELGLAFQGPTVFSRQPLDGPLLEWKLGFTEESKFGRYLPFYIDWLDTVHPSKAAPTGIELVDFQVVHPNSSELRAIYEKLDIEVPVVRGDRPGMRALIRASGIDVVLSSLS